MLQFSEYSLKFMTKEIIGIKNFNFAPKFSPKRPPHFGGNLEANLKFLVFRYNFSRIYICIFELKFFDTKTIFQQLSAN